MRSINNEKKFCSQKIVSKSGLDYTSHPTETMSACKFFYPQRYLKMSKPNEHWDTFLILLFFLPPSLFLFYHPLPLLCNRSKKCALSEMPVILENDESFF